MSTADLIASAVVYLVFVAIVYYLGSETAVSRGSWTNTERRNGARIALLSPVWPVLIPFLLGWLAVRLIWPNIDRFRQVVKIARSKP